jgi:regulation of enolase protein 1 (concanavalin A-like superfamily)
MKYRRNRRAREYQKILSLWAEQDAFTQESQGEMSIDFNTAEWINPPRDFEISENSIKLITDPNTDFWQRSYYGFRNDNAPALLVESEDNFTFTVKASFEYQERYDQCGVIIYIDSENWFKASIEYETREFSRLGSVVTNHGYSDWATTDISTMNEIWYRLSRRGPDFLIESSLDGEEFRQMRIFHLHQLGETTAEMGKLNPPAQPEQSVKFGIYACSPLCSSFTALFEEFVLEECKWLARG